jgi:hypothetical protein
MEQPPTNNLNSSISNASYTNMYMISSIVHNKEFNRKHITILSISPAYNLDIYNLKIFGGMIWNYRHLEDQLIIMMKELNK